MVDERPEDTTLPPDSARPKRAPPTIDLEASEVSGETQNLGASAERKRAFPLPSAGFFKSCFGHAFASSRSSPG